VVAEKKKRKKGDVLFTFGAGVVCLQMVDPMNGDLQNFASF
jgi:hypothetical protein